MVGIFIAALNQTITFLPQALALYISFCILRTIDMTLDGSFVLGAAIFARLVELNASPVIAASGAVLGGIIAGIGVGIMQRGQKIDSLLAGVLATFILLSGNLLIMGRPNISLLSASTLVSQAFETGQLYGWVLTALLSSSVCLIIGIILFTRFGLILRAFGDNPVLLARRGKPIERYRLLGFAMTNGLAAVAGCLTAQTIGYADIGMSYGMTLTAFGTVILGKQLLALGLLSNKFSIGKEFSACIIGVLFYFFAVNGLLRLEINPVYLKMLLGMILIVFLRMACITKIRGQA